MASYHFVILALAGHDVVFLHVEKHAQAFYCVD